MSSKSPSQAKNAIKRSLWCIVDPPPKQVDSVWNYFQSQCAYCGLSLKRENRDGHMDHLISIQEGMVYGLGNFVLSCGHCNGDEKREEDWRSFLRRKNEKDEEHLQRREQLIDEWKRQNEDAERHVTAELRSAVEASIARVIAAYDAEVEQLRLKRQTVTASSNSPA